jgi:TolA-binding protein
MKRVLLLFVGLAIAWPSPAQAQVREHAQMLADLRMLQEQVQRLQLSVNTLAEQLKATQQAIDTQAGEMRKGFADQTVAVGGLSAGQRSLVETEKDSAIRIARLGQEFAAIREAAGSQQALLTQILELLQAKPGGAAGVTDPATAPKPTAPAPAGLPPSPSSYFNVAWSAYASNQFEEAIRIYKEALERFPDSVEAPAARMNVGDAYLQLNKPKEALEAFTAVITLHKDSDEVPNAYYKQGVAYQRLEQKANAEKSYQFVRKQYPDSAAAALATVALKKMGVIKN